MARYRAAKKNDKFLGHIGERRVKMMLTGSAVRTNGIIKVYNIKSYIEKGQKIRDAQGLANADCAKQLHLDILFPLTGSEMAEAFTRLIRLNYPAPALKEEVQALADTMRRHAVARGDQVWLTHVPGVGLHYRLVGNTEKLIRNVEFSRAVWNNFLGEHNVGEHVKKGLVSELQR